MSLQFYDGKVRAISREFEQRVPGAHLLKDIMVSGWFRISKPPIDVLCLHDPHCRNFTKSVFQNIFSERKKRDILEEELEKTIYDLRTIALKTKDTAETLRLEPKGLLGPYELPEKVPDEDSEIGSLKDIFGFCLETDTRGVTYIKQLILEPQAQKPYEIWNGRLAIVNEGPDLTQEKPTILYSLVSPAIHLDLLIKESEKNPGDGEVQVMTFLNIPDEGWERSDGNYMQFMELQQNFEQIGMVHEGGDVKDRITDPLVNLVTNATYDLRFESGKGSEKQNFFCRRKAKVPNYSEVIPKLREDVCVSVQDAISDSFVIFGQSDLYREKVRDKINQVLDGELPIKYKIAENLLVKQYGYDPQKHIVTDWEGTTIAKPQPPILGKITPPYSK